jgi:hypothetical protein
MLEKSQEKTVESFSCDFCNYRTSKKSDFNKHQLTAKHKRLTLANDVSETVNDGFLCAVCSKRYESRVGLWSHKKKCFPVKTAEEKLPDTTTSIILELIKENQEFKSLLIEQMKENQKENKELMNKMAEITHQQLTTPANVTNNNNNTINNNQKFNLNFFLNETCKDAMNIQDFIDSIRVTFEDLNTIGNVGFVNGLSDIFIKQLRDLDVEKRPIHCTDSKRDTIYLKEKDSWNKDDKDKTRLKQIIEKIEYKNVAALHNWCNENPDSKVNNTPNNLLRDKIYLQTLQGDETTREKIIKNISREVVIDK